MALEKKYKIMTKCRVSEGELIDVLHLGEQPLANSLKNNQNNSEGKFPLSISFCEQSSLLQLNQTFEKEKLFNHYLYSSFNGIQSWM